MTKVKLLPLQEALAAATAIRKRYTECEDGGLDPRRALDGASVAALLSLAVLAGQFDRLAQAAAALHADPDRAAFVLTDEEFALFEDLQEQLVAAGYLPLPETQQKEPAHGEG